MYSFVLYFVALCILYKLFTSLIARFKYDIHKVPKAPAYPIIGHLHHFAGFDKPRFSVWLYKWYQKLGQPPIMLVTLSISFLIKIKFNTIYNRWIPCSPKWSF